MIPEDVSTLGVLQGVHVRDRLDLQWPAGAFRLHDAVLLRNANRDVGTLADPSEADPRATIDGQRIEHPEVVPCLAIDHCGRYAGEGALERPDEILDCLLRRGPGQRGERQLPGERKKHRHAHNLWLIGTMA
jgi:hypothetical protein